MPNQEMQENISTLDASRMEELTTGFAFGYDFLSKDGVLEALKKHANEAGSLEALTTYIVRIIKMIIDEFGIVDSEVLFYIGINLISDAADRLIALGIEVNNEELEGAIAQSIKGILSENPEVVNDMSQNPNMAQHVPDELKQGGGQQQPQQSGLLDPMPQQAPPPQEVPTNGV